MPWLASFYAPLLVRSDRVLLPWLGPNPSTTVEAFLPLAAGLTITTIVSSVFCEICSSTRVAAAVFL